MEFAVALRELRKRVDSGAPRPPSAPGPGPRVVAGPAETPRPEPARPIAAPIAPPATSLAKLEREFRSHTGWRAGWPGPRRHPGC